MTWRLVLGLAVPGALASAFDYNGPLLTLAFEIFSPSRPTRRKLRGDTPRRLFGFG